MKPIFFILALSLLSTLISCHHEEKEKEKEVTFDKLLKKLQSAEMKIISVAGSDNIEILKSVRIAKDIKIANSILVGDAKRTKEIAEKEGVKIDDFELIDIPDQVEAANTAVKLVHDHKADMYMKGSVETKFLLRSALNKEFGLRTGNPLSLIAVFEVEGLHKMLFLTDPAIMPYPTLDDKVNLINNAVDVVRACGISQPKVAPIATVEVVNPKMPCTVEAATLTKMNEEGKIKNCIVDGPLSMDLAIDPHAALLKKMDNRKIQGDADILLFPDIHGANFSYKLLTHVAKSKSGNIVVGTSAPIILTSRADSTEVKLNSIVLASIYAHYLAEKN